LTLEELLSRLGDPEWIVRTRAILEYARPSAEPEPMPVWVPGPFGEPAEPEPTAYPFYDPVPGDPRAIEPLLALADDPTKNVRNAVAWAIGAIAETAPDRSGIERVTLALADPNWRVRFAAARACRWWLADEPFEPLVAVLDDSEEGVRWAASAALAERSMATRGRDWNSGLLEPLLQAMRDPAPTVRGAGAAGLKASDDDRALEALTTALGDSDYRVRHFAALGLDDLRAVPALIEALNDQYFWTRATAATMLGRLRAEDAVDGLVEQLRTKNRAMRISAASALAEIGDPRAIPPLQDLYDRSTNAEVRGWVRGSLKRLGA
jgi:HEAT repeat protein